MTEEPISVTNRGVPKTRLEDVTIVRFRAGTLERIDAIAGKNRRAKWIREQIEAALRALDALSPPPPPEDKAGSEAGGGGKG